MIIDNVVLRYSYVCMLQLFRQESMFIFYDIKFQGKQVARLAERNNALLLGGRYR